MRGAPDHRSLHFSTIATSLSSSPLQTCPLELDNSISQLRWRFYKTCVDLRAWMSNYTHIIRWLSLLIRALISFNLLNKIAPCVNELPNATVTVPIMPTVQQLMCPVGNTKPAICFPSCQISISSGGQRIIPWWFVMVAVEMCLYWDFSLQWCHDEHYQITSNSTVCSIVGSG